MGECILGVGSGARREKEENWWDRETPSAHVDESAPVIFGRQTELFDETGQAVFTPAEPAAELTIETPAAAPVPKYAPRVVPQTIVSVQSRSRTTARVVATTRAASATRVAAVAKTASAAHGAVARQLMMSQSISSGREESRWFSVPQRVLLPRYQLFEGAEAVTEEEGGGLRLGARSMRGQRGHVWFV